MSRDHDLENERDDEVLIEWCVLRLMHTRILVAWSPSRHTAEIFSLGDEGCLPVIPEPAFTSQWTWDALEEAREWLSDQHFERLRSKGRAAVLEPESVNLGVRVRLSISHKNQKRNMTTEVCPDCQGSGKWGYADTYGNRLVCRKCQGDGKVTTRVEKIMDDRGKQAWENFDVGVAGVVEWLKSFQGRYPQRDNDSEVRVKLDDGRELRTPLRKLRLDIEAPIDADLRDQADSLAGEWNPIPFISLPIGKPAIIENMAVVAARSFGIL